MVDLRSKMKKVFYTEIMKNEPIAADVYSMTLAYPDELCSRSVPGQFVNLYLNRKDLLLPRPISICRVVKGGVEENREEGRVEKGQAGKSRTGTGRIVLVYRVTGAGTKELAGYSPGTLLRVSSPLGNGYDLSALEPGKLNGKTALVVGGGIGVPPLLELTHRLADMGVSVQAVLGFREEPFLHEEFEKAGASVHLATDSGKFGFHGTVVELLRNGRLEEAGTNESTADACFACGPAPMLRALSRYCADFGIESQVSLEERMGCGFGACVGCVRKIKTPAGVVQKKVCKDGPVFFGEEVVWDD
jgi:dihydroorotate dehydrogenase electron transfer subunit